MKSHLRVFLFLFFAFATFAWAGTKSAIVTDTSVVINLRVNQVFNVHQYYFSAPSNGASISLGITIGAENYSGLFAKQVNDFNVGIAAFAWPERPFKVGGPAVVTVPAAPGFKSFITYSIDPR